MKKLLSNDDILRYNHYIGGKWLGGSSATKLSVTNPANGEPVAEMQLASKAEVVEAIECAVQAQSKWRYSSYISRQELLLQWANFLAENSEDVAKMITAENGKPMKEALHEVSYSVMYIALYAEEIIRLQDKTFAGINPSQQTEVKYEPVGVAALITPWNFPLAMLVRKIAPAIAAGCAVICKPSSRTPLSAMALARLAEYAGMPPGIINMIISEEELFSDIITADRRVRKVSFTGSTEVGKKLIRKSADCVQRISLELGGNAPAIICADANIKLAAKKVAASKFRASGQTCICANRILVHESVYEEFMAAFLDIVKNYKVGDGMDPQTDIGPLISNHARTRAISLIDEAIKDGAERVFGGKPLDELGEGFLEPAILKNVKPSMRVCREEIFAPIAPIMPFKSDDEALSVANDTEYGLAAYIFTASEKTASYFTQGLEFGMVGINDTSISNYRAPFGGIKESGYGREGGKEGLMEYMSLKYIAANKI